MIAISYRREDSLSTAGRLYDRLQAEFGKGNVFMDFDSIPYGVDFREHIKHMIDRSKVLVAMIGPDWMGKRKQRTRRIDDPVDFVRLEIAYALERGIPIIPVLINDTPMPKASELPSDIEGLAFRNAVALDVGIDFHHHADRLVAGINRLVIEAAKSAAVRKDHVSNVRRTIETPLTPGLFQEPHQTEGSKPAHEKPTAPPQKPPPPEIPKPIVETPRVKSGESQVLKPSRTKQETMAARLRSQKDIWIDRLKESITRLPGYKKIIILGAVGLFVIIGAAAIWYLGLVAKETTRKGGQESFTKSAMKLREQELAKVEPSVSAAPITVPSGPLQATPLPTSALSAGTLRIDSNPEGQRYEVIDASGKHHTGITPAVINDVAVGYSEVIYKRDRFPDHSEAVWINTTTSSSTTWTFPAKSAPTARNNRTWQAWIGDFVRQFVSANQLQDVEANLAFYASNVDYFDDHKKDQVYIRNDITKYNERWPTRRDSVEGDIRLHERVPDREYTASFKLNFYAESNARAEWSKGQFAIDLGISIIDGLPKISGIKEKVLRQQKGKTNAGGANTKPLRAFVAKDDKSIPTATFSSNQPKIHAFWQGETLKKGDKLRGVWIAEDVGNVAPKNRQIYEATEMVNGMRDYGVFSLTRPTNGWPSGRYRIEIYVGDQLADTVKFTIGGTAR